MRNTAELDATTVEALLAGTVGAEAGSRGLTGVAALLAEARVDAAAGALPGESATVAAMRAAVTGRPVGVGRRRPHPMLGRALALKAAVITGTLALGAGTAAAATGSLPAPLQSAAHDVLAVIGVRVPGGAAAAHDTDARSGHQRRSPAVVVAPTTVASAGRSSGSTSDPATVQTTTRTGIQTAGGASPPAAAPSPGRAGDPEGVRDRGAGRNGRHDPDGPGSRPAVEPPHGQAPPGTAAPGNADDDTAAHPRP